MLIRIHTVALIIALLNLTSSCQGQSKTNSMADNTSTNNPLLCDPDTGICEVPNNAEKKTITEIANAQENKLQVIYFTDPICSACWAIEPQLRKLKLEYGQFIDIEYRMGGLLPDWNYNSGGISKPSDVAHHWDEVSIHYDMPIDGDIWLEDPLDSSYPPSIAFIAAQLQDKGKALLFLREIREMVFLKKMNIAKWEHLALAAKNVGLDADQLKTDFDGKAKTLFEEDLKLAKALRVRGFPTLFFTDEEGNRTIVYGSKPYASFEQAILKLNANITKSEYNKSWETLFSKYTSFTAKEFSALAEIPRVECEQFLNDLMEEGKLQKMTTKNGAIWTVAEVH